MVVSALDAHYHEGIRSIQSRSLVVVVRFLVRCFLVENDLVCDYESFASLDGGCLVGCFDVGIGYHCSFDESEGGLAMVKSLL